MIEMFYQDKIRATEQALCRISEHPDLEQSFVVCTHNYAVFDSNP